MNTQLTQLIILVFVAAFMAVLATLATATVHPDTFAGVEGLGTLVNTIKGIFTIY